MGNELTIKVCQYSHYVSFSGMGEGGGGGGVYGILFNASVNYKIAYLYCYFEYVMSN